MYKTGLLLLILLEVNILTNNVKTYGTVIMTTLYVVYTIQKIKIEQVDVHHQGSWLRYIKNYFKKKNK